MASLKEIDILLKKNNKKVMIVGLKQKQVDTGEVWDYSSCLYPEGMNFYKKLGELDE